MHVGAGEKIERDMSAFCARKEVKNDIIIDVRRSHWYIEFKTVNYFSSLRVLALSYQLAGIFGEGLIRCLWLSVHVLYSWLDFLWANYNRYALMSYLVTDIHVLWCLHVLSGLRTRKPTENINNTNPTIFSVRYLCNLVPAHSSTTHSILGTMSSGADSWSKIIIFIN